jgi:hypothetical protein
MESTKDDEIPVNVVDAGERGFGVCFCLRRGSFTAGISSQWIRVDLFLGTVRLALMHKQYELSPAAQLSIRSSRPGAAVRA